MGWSLNNLSADTRERIARSLFKANERVDIVNGDTWINGLCPLHEDARQSFGYNISKDVFHCLAVCSPDGDLVDLWCEVHGYARRSPDGFNAFKRAFATERGVGAPARKTPSVLKRKQEKTHEPERKVIPESLYQTFGSIPGVMLAELRIRRGWSKDIIEKFGIRLLTHYRKASTPYDLFPIKEKDRVVIPIRDRKGTLYNLRVYYPFGIPEGASDTTQKIISWAKGHGHNRLFPDPSVLPPRGPVLLCEGEADCLCAWSQGISAITQTSKTSHWEQADLEALGDREVIIAYDADKAGQRYSYGAAQSLSKAGITVRILQWPDYMGKLPDGSWPDGNGQDLTDFFIKHHKDIHAFYGLMERAVPHGSPILSAPLPTGEIDNEHFYLRFFRTSASGRLSFGERLLADYLIEKNPTLYHDKSGQLYRWEDSHYVPWSEEQFRKEAIISLGEEATASRVKSSCSLAMSLVSMPHGRELNDRHEWVCLKNGMFNLYTLELKPHEPDFMSTIMLGASWYGDKTPKPERWLAFLYENVQTPQVIMQIQEFFGYCLTRDTRFDKAMLMLGPGADGKSQCIKVLRELVGPQNCSAVSMSGLEDQFQRAALFGKILNVSTEITTDAIQSEMFKAIVTGDPIQASFKHKDSFEYAPFCKMVFASNKMPRALDNSDGYFRRILPILFKRQYLENDPDRDPNLLSKFMAEIDGIFAWAIIGLHRLMQQNGFTSCDETLDFMMKYRRYNNPVMAFVQDRCSLDAPPEAETKLKELYKAYKEFCREGGFSPLNRENFLEELKAATRKLREDAAIRCHRPRVNGQRVEMVAGILLNQEVAAPPPEAANWL